MTVKLPSPVAPCARVAIQIAAMLSIGGAMPAGAQGSWPAAPVAVGSYTEERLREMQLDGDARTAGWLLRSMSSSSTPLPGSDRALRVSFVMPVGRVTYNSALPYSLNDGALWAGRGVSVGMVSGLRADWKRFHVMLLPELAYTSNRRFPAAKPPTPGMLFDSLYPPYHEMANRMLFRPAPGRSPYASPFHQNQSIDLPIRFGDRQIRQVGPGQSTAWAGLGPVDIGVSTENQWWGPAIRNSLLLSNNAPGFGHGFLRTARPLQTRVGAFEGRWLVGILEESPFFDADERNDLRSISMLGLTWNPRWEPGLTVGLGRAVYAPHSRDLWLARTFTKVFDVFRSVGQPNALPIDNPQRADGPDQITALFFRWVFPRDGFELYGEWGKAEEPKSLKEFLQLPNHSQGYTLGLQWLGNPTWGGGRPRVQTELTYLEQDASYRQNRLGSWYTSRAAVHGYTHRGQMLGAAIGPGSSSQWVSLDYVHPTWYLGSGVSRVRWLEDVHSQTRFLPNKGWCEHDVSLLPGLRGGAWTKWGAVSVDYSTGWRRNVFFENRAAGCAQDLGRNLRTQSLTFVVTPTLDVPLWFR